MSPEEIKIEIFKRRKRPLHYGIIAESVGVSRQAVYGVIERHFISLRIMEGIAAAIDRHRLEVFPESVNVKPRPVKAV